MIYCKRCLLSEIDKDKYFENVYEYISLIPTEQKCSEELYRERLELCKNCDSLVNGMCSECGCFVEVRAVRKISRCPSAERRW